jgi:roadblock/LC7 domain-containing protein
MTSSPEFNPKTPLQHQPLNILRTYRGSLDVPFNAVTRIICCVRNPYDRVISDMFNLGYINQYNSADEVFTQMVAYLQSPMATQVSFIVGEFGNVSNDTRIVRVESIVADMRALGYTDFTGMPWLGRGSWSLGRQSGQGPTYAKYLNDDSRDLVKQLYDSDFNAFGYVY